MRLKAQKPSVSSYIFTVKLPISWICNLWNCADFWHWSELANLNKCEFSAELGTWVAVQGWNVLVSTSVQLPFVWEVRTGEIKVGEMKHPTCQEPLWSVRNSILVSLQNSQWILYTVSWNYILQCLLIKWQMFYTHLHVSICMLLFIVSFFSLAAWVYISRQQW